VTNPTIAGIEGIGPGLGTGDDQGLDPEIGDEDLDLIRGIGGTEDSLIRSFKSNRSFFSNKPFFMS